MLQFILGMRHILLFLTHHFMMLLHYPLQNLCSIHCLLLKPSHLSRAVALSLLTYTSLRSSSNAPVHSDCLYCHFRLKKKRAKTKILGNDCKLTCTIFWFHGLCVHGAIFSTRLPDFKPCHLKDHVLHLPSIISSTLMGEMK